MSVSLRISDVYVVASMSFLLMVKLQMKSVQNLIEALHLLHKII